MVGAVKRQTAAGVPKKVHKWQRPIGNMTFLHQRFGSKRREGNSFGATFTSSGTSGWLMDTLRGLPRVLRELAGVVVVSGYWMDLLRFPSLLASLCEETAAADAFRTFCKQRQLNSATQQHQHNNTGTGTTKHNCRWLHWYRYPF